MNLDDTFCFKLGFDKKKDEKGRVYYKKTYGDGAYALVTALEGQDDIADDAFHVAYHNEPLNVLMENDCESPMGGEFFLSNALEMTKNMKK